MTEELEVPNGMIRIDCTAEGLTDAWMYLSDRGWTIATIESLKNNMKYDPARGVEWVHKYVRGMSLPVLDVEETAEGGAKPTGPVTDPKALTVEILTHYMDGGILGFIISGIATGAQYTLTTSPFEIGVSLPGAVAQRTNGRSQEKVPEKRARRQSKSRSAR